MSKYREMPIGDICSRFSSGKAIAASCVKNKGLYPVYGGNGLRGYTDIYNFEGECAIIGRQGAYCGNVRYFKGKAYMTEHAIVACAKEKYNIGYIAYLLSIMHLEQYQGQSAQPGLSVNTLSKVKVLLPNKEIQDSVFKILQSLECKIENNKKINAELEAMARTIYDYWFLQFDFPDENGRPYKSSGGKMVWNEELKREIPEGWKDGIFADFFEIGNGRDHKHLLDGAVPVYGSGGIMRYVNDALYNGESVLIPRKGTLNNIFYIKDAFWTVDTMYFTKMKKENAAIFMYYTVKQYDFEKMNTGTGVPSMTSSIIYSLKTVIPKLDILRKFDDKVQSIYDMIEQNKKQNKELVSLRDFLLPLLMNGQVGFKEC